MDGKEKKGGEDGRRKNGKGWDGEEHDEKMKWEEHDEKNGKGWDGQDGVENENASQKAIRPRCPSIFHLPASKDQPLLLWGSACQSFLIQSFLIHPFLIYPGPF